MSLVNMKVSQYLPQDFEGYVQNDRPEMLCYIPKNASIILDVGCALGNFGRRLKTERSIEVWGVEINDYAASVATKELDRVYCGAFDESLNLPQHHFDCIVFNDVLEHLVDPYSALLYAKELLREGGKIVASIPNVRYFDNILRLLIRKDWQYTEKGILDRTHLRFFTYKSIIRTFEDLGFSVDLIEGITSLKHMHPQHVGRFKWLNFLLLNQLEDMQYLQFAVIASSQVP
jgi:2-polyprenyl-3-methyl-5-hydroxy-6-metoxy-1,4-benzoquinol methylase